MCAKVIEIACPDCGAETVLETTGLPVDVDEIEIECPVCGRLEAFPVRLLVGAGSSAGSGGPSVK